MTEDVFKAQLNTSNFNDFKVGWRSPSNIALVKYWGKKPIQIPANASLSFTLSESCTSTEVQFSLADSPSFDLVFEGKAKPSFHPKIQDFLDRISPYCSFLGAYHLSIDTSNSFPHSSGIASSASAMAALALSICSLEKELGGLQDEGLFFQKASFLSRLGSGSACRSVQGPMMSWGVHPELNNSSDLYGSVFKEKLQDVFKSYKDSILLVHKGQKSVSSTAGHDLMKGHIFAQSRFEQAQIHLTQLKSVLQNGDLEHFIRIVESEALSLHAMMMSSHPYYILMQPNTLAILHSVMRFRQETKIPLCFTLDAGANVHLLYPESFERQILPFIEQELSLFCEHGAFLSDAVGNGSQKIV
ncbi:MAG: diphosphomevalonate decarboxylase [Flavobacteriaceae bacterium]|nr:diphosphomevalonate decarboxylase [Flavobacteriaceae bacterium]